MSNCLGTGFTNLDVFQPIVDAPVTATTTSASYTFPTGGSVTVVLVTNNGQYIVYVALGSSTVVAMNTSTPVLPGRSVAALIGTATTIAYLSASNSCPLDIQAGNGTPWLVFGQVNLAPGAFVQAVAPMVTPVPPSGALILSVAGASQQLCAAGEATNGVLILNSATAAQQNIATAESIFVNYTGGAATASAGGQSFEVLPGQSFIIPPGCQTAVNWTAATIAHRITATVG